MVASRQLLSFFYFPVAIICNYRYRKMQACEVCHLPKCQLDLRPLNENKKKKKGNKYHKPTRM